MTTRVHIIRILIIAVGLTAVAAIGGSHADEPEFESTGFVARLPGVAADSSTLLSAVQQLQVLAARVATQTFRAEFELLGPTGGMEREVWAASPEGKAVWKRDAADALRSVAMSNQFGLFNCSDRKQRCLEVLQPVAASWPFIYPWPEWLAAAGGSGPPGLMEVERRVLLGRHARCFTFGKQLFCLEASTGIPLFSESSSEEGSSIRRAISLTSQPEPSLFQLPFPPVDRSGYLLALDLQSGAPVWQARTAGAQLCRMLVTPETVIAIGEEHYGAGTGLITAVDTATGAARFVREAPLLKEWGACDDDLLGEQQPGPNFFWLAADGLRATSTSTGEDLWLVPFEPSPGAGIVGAGAFPLVMPGIHPDVGDVSQPATITSFDASTAAVLWSAARPVGSRGWVVGALLPDTNATSACMVEYLSGDDPGGFGVFDIGLLCIRLENGQTRWRSPLGRSSFAAPPVAGDDVVLAVQAADKPIGILRAFDAQTGDPLWSRDGVMAWRDAFTIGGGTAYVISGIYAGAQVIALDSASGLVRWTRDAPEARMVAASAGIVTVARWDHGHYRVDGLRSADGTVEWSTELPGESPYLVMLHVEGRVYIGTPGILFDD